jgi:hypothetical protein
MYLNEKSHMLNVLHLKRNTGWVVAVLLVSVSTLAYAQEVTVRAELDTNRALIGDQLTLFLSVVKPPDLKIDFPALKDTISRKVEIISDSYSDTTYISKSRIAFGRTLVLTVFDTGFFVIPSLDFVTHQGLSTDTLHTSALHFEILSVKTDSTLHGIKSNMKAPLSMKEVLYYARRYYPFIILFVALVALMFYVVRKIRRKRGQGEATAKEIPAELPEIVALRELERLKDEKPWLHGKVKHYHIQVSETLRRYIEGRYNIMALEQTTDEILIALKSPVCKTADHSMLSGILKLADLVKFAKVIPEENENAAQVDLAAEFVRSTSQHADAGIPDADPRKTLNHHNMLTGNA